MSSSHNPDTGAILSTSVRVIAQTFVYGILFTLMPIAWKVLRHKGSRDSSYRLFWLTAAAFVLSTAYWALSLAYLVSIITGRHLSQVQAAQTIFNAVVLINFIFADGVVVWRMHVLCAAHFPRKILLIPFLLFGILCVSVMGTIILRVIASVSDQSTGLLFTVVQACSSATSLATNLAATILICIWVYQRRQSFLGNSGISARLEQTITLLVESGIAYCISTAILVIVSGIHIPLHGSIIDIYKPVHAQIAGMYPAFVIILIHSVCSTQQMTLRGASSGILSEDMVQITNFSDSQDLNIHDSDSSSRA
ncbi:hypothetical protein BDY19DRAFT_561084 [Irpex rosettiformis]|uniref:Uncharacterized protein n=1 Tax=Irpex rosettiformis TaxID=378272 RepID=A0ACB8TPY9_9APHY|nr:hypothetical protein BDY19DRAFT_561084 [Irpex rosettiformis]